MITGQDNILMFLCRNMLQKPKTLRRRWKLLLFMGGMSYDKWIASHKIIVSQSINRYHLLLSPILQTFMGIFYNIHSVALIEDLPLEHKYDTPQEFFSAANNSYKQVKHCKFPMQIWSTWFGKIHRRP